MPEAMENSTIILAHVFFFEKRFSLNQGSVGASMVAESQEFPAAGGKGPGGGGCQRPFL